MMPSKTADTLLDKFTAREKSARRRAIGWAIFFLVPLVVLFGYLAWKVQAAGRELADRAADLELQKIEAAANLERLHLNESKLRQDNERLEAIYKELRASQERIRAAAELPDPKVAIAKVQAELAAATPANRAATLWKRGDEARAAKRPEIAETFFKAALSEDPAYAPALNGLGLLAGDRGDRAAAERFYRSAVEQDPKYKYGFYNLANLSFLRHNVDEAEQYAKRALEIDPTYQPARDLLSHVAEARQQMIHKPSPRDN